MPRRDVDVFAILNDQLAKVSDSDTPVRMIPLTDIHPNPRNFYPRVDNLDDLVESIQANGLLEPLTVVPDQGGGYRLISGHNRLAALKRAAVSQPDRWAKIPCLVLPAMDEHVELAAIIESNRQRVKTKALLAEEADKLTEAYMARKRAGENLPGRIRDHVAEAMQISKTKLANLNAIRNGIKVPGITAKWERDEIPEAAALEIARLPVEAQYRLLDWVIDGHHSYSMRDVRQFSVMWGGCSHKCPETGGFCPHAQDIYDQDFHGGEWHGAGCCKGCLQRDTCPAACHYANQEQPEEQPPEPQVPSEDYGGGIAPPPKLENQAPWTPDTWEQSAKQFSARLRAERERTGLDRKAFAEKIGQYKATYSAWENGSLPGSSVLPSLAVTLGVSTDYLYGLTDDPSPRPAPVQWQLLDKDHWPADQQTVILCWDNGLGENCYATARCVGGYYDTYPFEDTNVGCYLDEPANGDYSIGYWWIPLPEKEEQHESDNA